MPPVSNKRPAADDSSFYNGLEAKKRRCAADQTDRECLQAREPVAFRLARQLEEDIKSKDMESVFHPGAVVHFCLWSMNVKSFLRKEGKQEGSVSAIAWKELIDLWLLAEILDPDLKVEVTRIFRYKSKLETMPGSLIPYIYNRTSKGSAFREAILEETVSRIVCSLSDLIQGQKRYPLIRGYEPIKDDEAVVEETKSRNKCFSCSLQGPMQGQRGYLPIRGYESMEDDEEEEDEDGTTHRQLLRKLMQLQIILDLAKEKGKAISTEDEEPDAEETEAEETEAEETEAEETEAEEMEDDTDYEKDNDEGIRENDQEEISVKDGAKNGVDKEEAKEILRSIAKLITNIHR